MPSSDIYQCLTKMTVFKKVLQGTVSHPHLVSSVGCEWYVTGMSSRLMLSSNSDTFGYLREERLFWAQVTSAWGEEYTALLYWLLSFPFFTLLEPYMSQTHSVLTERSLQAMEGEALFWVWCKSFCDELIVKGDFLEMLQVFVILEPSSRWCVLSAQAKHCRSI